MNTVFLVSSGSYSDYRIESVWSTRKAAEAEMVQLLGVDRCGVSSEIEEYILDGGATEGLPYWEVSFRKDPKSGVQSVEATLALGRIGKEEMFVGNHQYQKHGNATFNVRGGSADEVIKIAVERRASLLAVYAGQSEQEGNWVDVGASK